MKKLLLNAPGRFLKSFGYSWDGFKATFNKEESFRLESLAFIAVLIGLCLSGWPLWKCFALIASFLLIPLAEILNSAIEDICDGITREQALFVKNAKDKGALAVLMAILVNVFVLAALVQS